MAAQLDKVADAGSSTAMSTGTVLLVVTSVCAVAALASTPNVAIASRVRVRRMIFRSSVQSARVSLPRSAARVNARTDAVRARADPGLESRTTRTDQCGRHPPSFAGVGG